MTYPLNNNLSPEARKELYDMTMTLIRRIHEKAIQNPSFAEEYICTVNLLISTLPKLSQYSSSTLNIKNQELKKVMESADAGRAFDFLTD